MDFKHVNSVYLIGIGGIGMSALARYFKFIGKNVAGYDKTSTAITDDLSREGIPVYFNDSVEEIPGEFQKRQSTVIVYTPAIPEDHKGYLYFKKNDFSLHKRSVILGEVTNKYKTIAIAGTHGKTSVSTATAHILNQSDFGCLAFLGGISKNYGTNLLLPKKLDNFDQYAVVEADEFDRSFLQLKPYIGLITSMDADHLDIYESKENVVESFNHFVKNIAQHGIVIYKKGLDLKQESLPAIKYTYSLNGSADFYAKNLQVNNSGLYNFDLVTPKGVIENLQSGVPGKVNAENAVAAASLAYVAGMDNSTIRRNLSTFSGVQRRFDFQINNEKIIFIDDYAHHPEELKAFISSVKEIYPNKRITGIFQPHLYSRTRDFAAEFAKSLGLLDDLILLDIYPAREEPIEGVDSGIIFEKVSITSKKMCSLENLTDIVSKMKPELLLTMGAGNIDKKLVSIKKLFV